MPATIANERDIKSERFGTTLGILNLSKVQPLDDKVKDQMVQALQDPEVQHAVALNGKGNALAGLYDAQQIVAQHVQAAQQQVAAATAAKNPQAIAAARYVQ
jgi:hypothetical protein